MGVLELVGLHDRWRLAECLNLIPSENVTSPAVRAILASDLGHRYSMRPEETPDFELPPGNLYCGTRYADEIEEEGARLARELFGCKHVFLQPLSGHVAAMIVLFSVLGRGDRMMCIREEDGGYPGYTPRGIPSYLGLEVGYLPFNRREWDLDYEACREAIRSFRPKLVVIGASTILFPYDIKALREACDEVGALLAYDASHVLGLMAGGCFQPDALRAGVDVLFGSTHKTLFGPQGGIILTDDDELAERIRHNLKLRLLDNPHLNRIAALARTLEELAEHGPSYAAQVVRNAQALARALEEKGLPVLFGHKGYTRSHQLLLDRPEIERRLGLPYRELALRLEEANIIVDKSGRLGSQELTRFGMKEAEMEVVAELLSDVLLGRRKPSEVREDVIRLRKRFSTVHYC